MDTFVDILLYRIITPFGLCAYLTIVGSLLALTMEFNVGWTLTAIIITISFSFAYEFLINSNSTATPPDACTYNKSKIRFMRQRQIPMVILNELTPYDNGYAFGTMYRSAIRRVIPKLALFNFDLKPAEDYMIPADYMAEIQGMSDATDVPVDLFIQAHTMAERNGACTTIATESVFGRNLDWIPLDLAQETVVVVFKQQGLFVLTLPGLLCGPTMWTNTTIGAVNVSPEHIVLDENGTSMLFHFRHLMETSYTCEDVKEFSVNNKPHSPYHVTFKGPDGAISVEHSSGIHVLQTAETDYCLLTLNYDHAGNSRFNSYYRDDLLSEELHNNGQPSTVRAMQHWLRLVQTWITCHTVVATKTNVFLAYGNGYSASKQRYIQMPRWLRC